MWRHGDFAEITESGGVIIDGRSDKVLNPGGARIGTAEIYRQVGQIDEIQDSAAGAFPLPFVDMPLVAAIQLKLFQTIASAYQQSLSRKRLQDIGSAIASGFLSNLGKRQLLKLIPAYGAAAASVMTAASTYALSKTLDFYFSHSAHGDVKERAIYQNIYQEQLDQGKRLLKSYMKTRGREPNRTAE